MNKIDNIKGIKYNSLGRNILIGGAWPYANSSLHLGHLAALLPGDIIARYYRQNGDNVIYVSGTDCHGTPITQRAKREGKTAKEIAEEYHEEFSNTFKNIGFSYSMYGKTEDEYHKELAKKFFAEMYKNGYIYEKEDKQPFCNKCNSFLSDRELKLTCPRCGKESKGDQCDCGYIPNESDFKSAICAECGQIVELKSNKNLYLALSKLQPEIYRYFENVSNSWRINSRNETEKYFKVGLKDRAVTRDLNWGVDIPIQGYEGKKMYVWIEAVLGYITMAEKYCSQVGWDVSKFWGKDTDNKIYMVHGKDNIIFHSIILPALILALKNNYKLPDMMVSSEYLNINSEKISKSKGNGIKIDDIIENYNSDTLRYFLIANGPEKKDSNFSLEDYFTVHNSDVTNKYGNLVNRTLSFKGLEYVPNGKMDSEIEKQIEKTYKLVGEYIEKAELKKAIATIMDLVETGNKYYDDRKPWIQKKENIEAFNDTIYTCSNIVANLSNLYEPFMPITSQKVRDFLGITEAVWKMILIEPNTKITSAEPLFARITK